MEGKTLHVGNLRLPPQGSLYSLSSIATARMGILAALDAQTTDRDGAVAPNMPVLRNGEAGGQYVYELRYAK